MSIVFDTNIWLSALLWNNSVSNKLLQQYIQRNIQIYCSESIIQELKQVLIRDFYYTESEVEEIKIIIQKIASVITINVDLKIVKLDPEDDKIIHCAIESKASAIITYDKHLLEIKSHSGIQIITPNFYLNLL